MELVEKEDHFVFPFLMLVMANMLLCGVDGDRYGNIAFIIMAVKIL